MAAEASGGSGEGSGLARNVELKLRCDAETLSAIEGRLRDAGHELDELHQIDTYVAAAHGRLKVREIHSSEGNAVELIAYARPDTLGTRLSDYRRVAIPRAEGAGLLAALRSTLGELVVVEKRRRVVVVGRTRVHLDRVAGLGGFVELETVLGDKDDEAGGRAELLEVADALGIDAASPIAGSYGDLMLDRLGSRGADGADR